MMLVINQSPERSIGPITLGMKRADVHNALGDSHEAFKRAKGVAIPSDYYEKEGIFVYYKTPGVVEAVEVSKPAVPLFEGLDLLNMPFEELCNALTFNDAELQVDLSGMMSKKRGIAVFAPEAADGSNRVAQSVIVFEDGYYD